MSVYRVSSEVPKVDPRALVSVRTRDRWWGQPRECLTQAGEVLCAYCSSWTPIDDLPSSIDAECWDCVIKRYDPPKLPWWRVSAWE